MSSWFPQGTGAALTAAMVDYPVLRSSCAKAASVELTIRLALHRGSRNHSTSARARNAASALRLPWLRTRRLDLGARFLSGTRPRWPA